MKKQTCNQYWIRGKGVEVSQFLWLIVSKVKKKKKLRRPRKNFSKKCPIFKRELCRHVLLLNLGLCGASISENLTNKKQKHLKVTFCYPTESRHCKSSVNDTVYTEVFLESSLTWFLMQKLWISNIWETNY